MEEQNHVMEEEDEEKYEEEIKNSEKTEEK